jgi:hypothetical protein
MDSLKDAREAADRVLDRHNLDGIFSLREYALLRSLLAQAYLEGLQKQLHVTVEMLDGVNTLNVETARGGQ